MADSPKLYQEVAGVARPIPEGEEYLHKDSGSGLSHIISEAEGKALQQQEGESAWVNENLGPLAQGAIGVGSGLTMGLGPAAVTAIAPEYGGVFRGLDRSGGAAYQLGKVGGTIAPFLVGAGEAEAGLAGGMRLLPGGMVAGAGGAAERLAAGLLPEATSLLGKAGVSAAKMAARGGVEAGLMGMADHVSNGVIYNHPITAQSVMAAGADGALMGALLGGAMGAVAPVASEAGNRISRAFGEAGSKEAQATKVLKAMGADAGDIDRLRRSHGSLESAVKSFNEAVLNPLDEAFVSNPAKLNALARRAQEHASGAVRNAVEVLDKEAPGMAPNMDRVRQRLSTEVLEPMLGTMEERTTRKLLARYQSDLQNLAKAPTWENWNKSIDQMRAAVGDVAEGYKDLNTARMFSKDIQGKVLNVMQDEMAKAVEQATVGMAKKEAAMANAWGAAKVNELQAARFAELTSKGEAARIAPNPFEPDKRDIGLFLGSAAMGHPGTGLLAVGGRIIARQLDQLTGSAQSAFKSVVGASASNAVYQTKANMASGVRQFLNKNVDSVGVGISMVRPIPGAKSNSDYQKVVEKVNQLASERHRQKVMDYATKVAQYNPGLATNMVEAYDRAAQYLKANLPVAGSTAASMSLLAQPKEHGVSQQGNKFLRQANAVLNPASVVQGLMSGDISSDEVKAFKYVYPDLHQELVETAQREIYTAKSEGKSFSLNQVATLSIALDHPCDPFMEPDFVNFIQSTAFPPQGQKPGPKPGPPQAQLDTNLLTPIDQQLKE